MYVELSHKCLLGTVGSLKNGLRGYEKVFLKSLLRMRKNLQDQIAEVWSE